MAAILKLFDSRSCVLNPPPSLHGWFYNTMMGLIFNCVDEEYKRIEDIPGKCRRQLYPESHVVKVTKVDGWSWNQWGGNKNGRPEQKLYRKTRFWWMESFVKRFLSVEIDHVLVWYKRSHWFFQIYRRSNIWQIESESESFDPKLLSFSTRQVRHVWWRIRDQNDIAQLMFNWYKTMQM